VPVSAFDLLAECCFIERMADFQGHALHHFLIDGSGTGQVSLLECHEAELSAEKLGLFHGTAGQQ
jgi:hypothetical protein